jgi:hypothetical protein
VIEKCRLGAAAAYPRVFATRFPGLIGTFRRLLEEDPYFAALCEEHEDCVAALEFWKQSSAEQSPRLRSEYALLVMELEEEIWYYLGNSEQ